MWRGDLAIAAHGAGDRRGPRRRSFAASPVGNRRRRRRSRRDERTAIRRRADHAETPIVVDPARRHLERQLASRRATSLAIEFAGARTFRDVYASIVKSGRLRAMDGQRNGRPTQDALPDAEIVQWKSFDGRMIPGHPLSPGEALHRTTARDDQRARRTGSARAAAGARTQQLLPQRARDGDHLSEHPRLDRLRQDLRAPRRWAEARGCGQRHWRAARLDRRQSGTRQEPRDDDGVELRRLHHAGGGHRLRRSHPLRARGLRAQRLRGVSRRHRSVTPARPAGRVRRPCRSRDACVPQEHLPADPRGAAEDTALHRPGR